MDDLVFFSRNKKYGAYCLRKQYSERVLLSLALSVILLLFFIQLSRVSIIMNPISDCPLITSQVNLINLPGPPKEIQRTVIVCEMPPVYKKQPEYKINHNPMIAPVIKDELDFDSKCDYGEDENCFESVTIAAKEKTIEVDKRSDEIFFITETMPEYPGGYEKLTNYLKSHIKYPKEAIEKSISGTVYISFIIDQQGQVTDVNLLRGIGAECDGAAIKAVKKMPSWKPGLNEFQRPVKVRFNLPVKFILSNEEQIN